MASSYTTNLGLTLPTTGELAGTWGDVVNVGITALLDSAIAGTVTLSADADVTLSTTNGAANQARSAVILWTASNGATTRNVTAPAHTKAYIVINTGTGSVVIRGVGPTTGVTVTAGTQVVVAWNGTDFVRISSSVVAVTDITGLGTGVGTALAIAVGSAGAPVVLNGALGTPSSGSAANLSSFPTLNQNTSGYAESLKSATTTVTVSSATAPTNGQVLTATSGTAATWQTITGYQAQITAVGVLKGAGAGSISAATAGTDFVAPGTATNFTVQQYFGETTLTYNATQTWDVSTNQVAKVTLTGNVTFSAPTNQVAGGFYSIAVIQDATGSRTGAWNAVFKFIGGAAPTLSTAANAKDYITFRSDGTNMLEQGRALGVA